MEKILISWRSILAGFFLAFFVMAGLMGLGMAFGAIVPGEGIFTGVWFLSSALISIFTGSYFAARVSKFQTGRIGSAQGLVIASLFMGVIFSQTNSLKIQKDPAEKMRTALIQNASQYTQTVLSDLNLRDDPVVVSRNLTGRIIGGQDQGAKNYLAMETGLTPEEADARIADVKARTEMIRAELHRDAGILMRAAGWSLFFLVMLGALSSVLGGALGSVANFRNPLSREQFAAPTNHEVQAL